MVVWLGVEIQTFILRTSRQYLKYIRPKLHSDLEYQRLKKQIIDHPKTVKRLKVWAGQKEKEGIKADPIKYEKLRQRELHRILEEYDFVVVEIDALAARIQEDFNNLVLKAADDLFDQSIWDQVAHDEVHDREAIRRPQ